MIFFEMVSSSRAIFILKIKIQVGLNQNVSSDNYLTLTQTVVI